MPSVRTARARRAFSLLEMLVAIALLAVLLGAVYAFTWNLFDRETRTLDEAAKSEASTTLFDRLEADLMSAVASTGDGPGLVGGTERISIAHNGVLPGSPIAPYADLQTTTMSFDARTRRVTVTRTESSGSEADGDEAIPVPVRALRFRYHDGRGWSDRFTSTRGLPAAVELAIWFGEERDEAEGDADFDDFGAGPLGDEPAGFDDMMMGGFDDEPAETDELPAPDRVRIVTIPDAVLPAGLASGGTP